jgi:hypothetical protein
MVDQAVGVMDEVGERQFFLRSYDANAPDEDAMRFFWCAKTYSALARIAGFATLARALCSGIGFS